MIEEREIRTRKQPSRLAWIEHTVELLEKSIKLGGRDPEADKRDVAVYKAILEINSESVAQRFLTLKNLSKYNHQQFNSLEDIFNYMKTNGMLE